MGCLENLEKVYLQADATDSQRGKESYRHYHRLMAALGARHGFTTRTASAVFAALSPNNDYFGNVRDVDRLLRAAAERRDIESFKVSTYGHNKRKAWEIAHGADPLRLIKAKKTRSFFINMWDPENQVAVTIDGHMFNAWNARRVNLVGQTVSNKNYDLCAHDVRELATKHGLIPWQMQGVIWYCWRRLHGVRSPQQLDLWDRAYLAAGMFVPCS